MTTNQADYQKVFQVVITPLMRNYSAEYDKEIIDDYVRRLAKYPRDKLVEAVDLVIEENKRKPTLAHIVEKLKKDIQDNRTTGASDYVSKMYAEQELLQARARTAAADYTDWAMRQHEKTLESWPEHRVQYVKEYIYAAAVFQAEGLEGMRNRGYSSMCLGLSGSASDERRKWFFDMCKAAGNQIKVVVPFKWFEQPAAIIDQPVIEPPAPPVTQQQQEVF